MTAEQMKTRFNIPTFWDQKIDQTRRFNLADPENYSPYLASDGTPLFCLSSNNKVITTNNLVVFINEEVNSHGRCMGTSKDESLRIDQSHINRIQYMMTGLIDISEQTMPINVKTIDEYNLFDGSQKITNKYLEDQIAAIEQSGHNTHRATARAKRASEYASYDTHDKKKTIPFHFEVL